MMKFWIGLAVGFAGGVAATVLFYQWAFYLSSIS
jgi:hypothetical protein